MQSDILSLHRVHIQMHCTRCGCSKKHLESASAGKYSQYYLLICCHHSPVCSPGNKTRRTCWVLKPASAEVTLTSGATLHLELKSLNSLTFMCPKTTRKTRCTAIREKRPAGNLHQRKTLVLLVTSLHPSPWAQGSPCCFNLSGLQRSEENLQQMDVQINPGPHRWST